MVRQMNKNLMIRKISELVVKAGFDPETFDIPAHLDATLSYPENVNIIRKILQVTRARPSRKQTDDQYCSHLSEECEISCDRASCNQFRRIKCPGTVEPCPTIKKERRCPIIISPYCVNPFSYTRKKDGREINNPGYCLTKPVTRKCR